MAWYDRFRSIASIRKEKEELRCELEELRRSYEEALEENKRLWAEYDENTRRIEELKEKIDRNDLLTSEKE